MFLKEQLQKYLYSTSYVKPVVLFQLKFGKEFDYVWIFGCFNLRRRPYLCAWRFSTDCYAEHRENEENLGEHGL